MSEKLIKNMYHSGLIFMHTLHAQSQMSDLIILRNNPELIKPFVENPSRVPEAFHKIRVSYWEKMFGPVKNEFLKVFKEELKPLEIDIIEEIFHVRNMIAHCHVSGGRDYFLHRPSGEKKEQELMKQLNVQPVPDQSDPIIMVVDFSDDEKFARISNKMKTLGEQCFRRLCDNLGVPHSRIM